MSDALGRIELDEVPFPAPRIARAVEQVLDDITLARIDPHLPDRDLNPSLLCPLWISVDRDEDAAGGIPLAEPDEMRIVGLVEGQRPVLLQRRMIAANVIDARNQLAQVVGLIPVARLDLVFLRVEVLL